MPKELEKIKNDILAKNKSMSEDMAYALATNILKKRRASGVSARSSKARIKSSKAYKAYEKTERKDVESKESFAEVAKEAKGG